MGDLSSMILPFQPHQEEQQAQQHPEKWNSSMRIKLSQAINNKYLSPRIATFLPIYQKYLIVQLILLFKKHGDQSKQPHYASDNKESHIKHIRSWIWNENVYILGCFAEEKPVPWKCDQEVEHPKWPEIGEVEEEI